MATFCQTYRKAVHARIYYKFVLRPQQVSCLTDDALGPKFCPFQIRRH